ncbi:CvpA family protein [Elusimicrobiota bacterium]
MGDLPATLHAHWPDAAALACLLFFSYRGHQRGFLESATGIASLIAGYAAIMILSRPFGDYLMSHGIEKEWLAYSVGSVLAFMAAQVVVQALSGLVLRMTGLRCKSKPPRASRFGGAIIGMGTGAIYAVFLLWIVLIFRTMTGAPLSSTFSERLAEKFSSALTHAKQGPRSPGPGTAERARRELPPDGRKGQGARPDPAEEPGKADGGELLSSERFKEELSTNIKELPGRGSK